MLPELKFMVRYTTTALRPIMIHQLKDSDEILNEKIVISTFNQYSKEKGNNNGSDRVTIFAYEIRPSPMGGQLCHMVTFFLLYVVI